LNTHTTAIRQSETSRLVLHKVSRHRDRGRNSMYALLTCCILADNFDRSANLTCTLPVGPFPLGGTPDYMISWVMKFRLPCRGVKLQTEKRLPLSRLELTYHCAVENFIRSQVEMSEEAHHEFSGARFPSTIVDRGGDC
jgi:hypothetical protein